MSIIQENIKANGFYFRECKSTSTLFKAKQQKYVFYNRCTNNVDTN